MAHAYGKRREAGARSKAKRAVEVTEVREAWWYLNINCGLLGLGLFQLLGSLGLIVSDIRR